MTDSETTINEDAAMTNDINYKDIIAAIYRIVAGSERRFDDLRAADRSAVRLAHADLSKRLEGFPQQYATKVEMEQALNSLQRLEKDTMGRELYEQNHKLLVDIVAKLDRDKLSQEAFVSFMENYRIDKERESQERRNVAEVLASATEQVRSQTLEERGEYLTVEYYDTQHHALVEKVNVVERWQYKLIGGLIFATFVAPLLSGLIVYIVTHAL